MAYLAGGQMPEGAIESGLWLPLSINVGFGEELVFRGYAIVRVLEAVSAERIDAAMTKLMRR